MAYVHLDVDLLGLFYAEQMAHVRLDVAHLERPDAQRLMNYLLVLVHGQLVAQGQTYGYLGEALLEVLCD
jgi:hypothetical protein